MIPKTVFSVFSGLIFGASLFASLCSAQTLVAARQLKLVPEPKEVQSHEGAGFRVGPGTAILVNQQHQSEDRIAAETLAEEIAEQAGVTVSIATANQVPRREGKGYRPARLQDRGLREFLESQGIKNRRLYWRTGLRAVRGQFSPDCCCQYGARTLLWRANAAPIAASEEKEPGMPGRSHSRLAEHALAWNAGRYSRGPIPTMEFMKKQIRTLASYKVNLFGLYMEHVFDFASQPLMAPKEAALTPQEIQNACRLREEVHVTGSS